MAPARADALDGLRGLSALAVFFSHLINHFLPNLPYGFNAWLSVIAQMAVVVFFVLSGYVIAGSVRARSQDRPFDLLGFTLSRIARIYPPYLLAVLLCFGLGLLVRLGIVPVPAPLQGWPVAISPAALLRALTFLFTQGDLMTRLDGPLWSLRLEVLLYVVAACGAIIATWRGVIWRALAALLALVLLAGALRTLTGTVLAVGTFGIGALACLFASQIRALVPEGRSEGMALLALAVAPLLLGWPGPIPYPTPAGIALQIGIAALVAVFVAHLAGGGGTLNRPLTRAKPLGAFAYTLYVVHMPLLYAVALWASGPLAIVMGIGIVLPFAILAARIVENHGAVLSSLNRLLRRT